MQGDCESRIFGFALTSVGESWSLGLATRHACKAGGDSKAWESGSALKDLVAKFWKASALACFEEACDGFFNARCFNIGGSKEFREASAISVDPSRD